MVLTQSRQTDHWNRTESLERDSHKCENLINDRDDTEDHLGLEKLFNKWQEWKPLFIEKKKNEIGSLPHTIHKNKFQVEYKLKCELNL